MKKTIALAACLGLALTGLAADVVPTAITLRNADLHLAQGVSLDAASTVEVVTRGWLHLVGSQTLASLSSTGELTLDVSSRKMTVNTPRFQGLAAPAGTGAALQDLEIVSHSRDGSVSLVAMDGLKPISCANRLLFVRLTNALNSGMLQPSLRGCNLFVFSQSGYTSCFRR